MLNVLNHLHLSLALVFFPAFSEFVTLCLVCHMSVRNFWIMFISSTIIYQRNVSLLSCVCILVSKKSIFLFSVRKKKRKWYILFSISRYTWYCYPLKFTSPFSSIIFFFRNIFINLRNEFRIHCLPVYFVRKYLFFVDIIRRKLSRAIFCSTKSLNFIRVLRLRMYFNVVVQFLSQIFIWKRREN